MGFIHHWCEVDLVHFFFATTSFGFSLRRVPRRTQAYQVLTEFRDPETNREQLLGSNRGVE